MRRLTYTIAAAAIAMAGLSSAALAERYAVATDLNLRAGPGTDYPVILTIPYGRGVDLYGCLDDYNWCDVSYRGERGWVYADYLEADYDDYGVPVAEYGHRIGVPVITFSFGHYWDDHYRHRPWYAERYRWRDREYRRDARQERRERRERQERRERRQDARQERRERRARQEARREREERRARQEARRDRQERRERRQRNEERERITPDANQRRNNNNRSRGDVRRGT